MDYFKTDRLIGFSTGALARSDWRAGLNVCRSLGITAVELSALRFSELGSLVLATRSLDVRGLDYVSVHLPSKFRREEELTVLRLVEQLLDRRWNLILHPDAIWDWSAWRTFGNLVCLENMDKRKPVGRTREELQRAFDQLPYAGLCFDYGHARQVDPTMSQAARILVTFGQRLRQIHFSDVDSTNSHRGLNLPALMAFSRVRDIPLPVVPVILETLAEDVQAAGEQLMLARMFFSVQATSRNNIPGAEHGNADEGCSASVGRGAYR